ncbi:hypothetical protein NHF50_10570 [Flavobacterium sp. NRK F10]|uniref:hypothetical protein n=1 Tax=Flavobacterium sp. NRK F10 TaxID=2954931 RepID=UPI0020918702|nr:hypothetical protein [Flavobacterium sp. NRK F10]MCO6175487.1 hypothetical protein [Flavobacterium sp. NRK F10]
MEFKDIEKIVNYLEDRIITNFEKHFSYLVLDDFYGGGYKERIEDEFFYDEYFEEYEDTIINLLLEIEDKNESEFIEFKLRLIKLKRIIDNYLSKIPKDVEINSFKHNRNSQFLINQELDESKIIENLYNQLYINKLIDSNFDDFKSHFNKSWNTKIQWFGTELQIVNFVNLLIDKNILDKETQNFKHKLITSHFINKKGNSFTKKQLSSVYSNKKEMIPNDDITLSIIKFIIENK